MKTCSKCKEEKLFDAFSKNKNRKDGYQSNCKSCMKQYNETNKERISEYRKQYHINNKEEIAQYYETNKKQKKYYQKQYYDANKNYSVEYREANREQITEYQRSYQNEYKKANRAKINAIASRRRAVKLNATPSWLTSEQLQEIEELYEIAQAFKVYTGQEYHVDHIVPLQGKNVCGLHVPWNLQILEASENIRKSNKLLDN